MANKDVMTATPATTEQIDRVLANTPTALRTVYQMLLAQGKLTAINVKGRLRFITVLVGDSDTETGVHCDVEN